jgi:hypothetical protein
MATSKYKTKPGAHGTLYLYAIEYDSPTNLGAPRETTKLWAYNSEHAMERFADAMVNAGYEDSESYDFPRILTVKKVKTS